MMLCETISEIGHMIQSRHQGQMSWSMTRKLAGPYCKCHSSQQLFDLPNPSVDCLVLIKLMYESIFKLD